MKKIFVVLVVCFVFLGICFSVANAMTEQEKQLLIAQLKQRIAELQLQLAQMIAAENASNSNTNSLTSWCHNFNVNIKYNDIGTEVAALQVALQKEVLYISAQEIQNKNFGDYTLNAVNTFQEKYRSEILTPSGLTKATGLVGPATRAKLNKLYGCVTTSTTTGTLNTTNTTTNQNTNTTTNQTQTLTCTPNWTCLSWSSCTNSKQTRTCYDQNYCGLLTNKPAESQSCTVACMPSWQYGSWGQCVSGRQTRSVTDSNNCNTTVDKPATSQVCYIPTVELTATITDSSGTSTYYSGPVNVKTNIPINIVWSSAYTSSCTVSGYGNFTGNRSTAGVESVVFTSAGTYTLNVTCSGENGSKSSSLVFKVTNKSIVDVKVNGQDSPFSIESGKTVTVTWTSAYVTSCTKSGDFGTGWVANSGSTTLNVGTSTGEKQFSISCVYLDINNPSSSVPIDDASDSVQINVYNVPTVDFTISGADSSYKISSTEYEYTIRPGKQFNIVWSSTNADSCTAFGHTYWTGVLTSSGSEQKLSTLFSGTHTLGITCSNSFTTKSANLSLVVPDVPTVNVTVNGSDGPITINRGDALTINWSSANASSCTAYDCWTGSKLTDGSELLNIFNESKKTYFCELRCYNDSGLMGYDNISITTR